MTPRSVLWYYSQTGCAAGRSKAISGGRFAGEISTINASIGAGKTYTYAVQPDGALTEKRLFCELGSDGMTLDSEGNVYLTGKGVTVFDQTGKQIDHLAINEGWTANVTFGGKDRDLLFITASTSLYAVKLRVKGAQ